MVGRIQGITVEIGGDTTKLQTALKGVNTEIRNTQSQLRDVDKLLKLDPRNTELLLCGTGVWWVFHHCPGREAGTSEVRGQPGTGGGAGTPF